MHSDSVSSPVTVDFQLVKSSVTVFVMAASTQKITLNVRNKLSF